MRFTRAFLFVILVVTIAVGAQSLLSDPEHVKPDHAERPTAGVSAPLPLAAVGGDSDRAATGPIVEWIEGVQRAEWFEGVRAAEEAARVEAARRAAAERVAAPRAGGASASVECAAIAAEFGLPSWVLENESGCGANNWNGTGCGGRGCIGPTQIDLGHFANPSPWGGVGACWGLDPNVWADLIECTNRLSGGGSNLRPWGG